MKVTIQETGTLLDGEVTVVHQFPTELLASGKRLYLSLTGESLPSGAVRMVPTGMYEPDGSEAWVPWDRLGKFQFERDPGPDDDRSDFEKRAPAGWGQTWGDGF